jgi:hypothetical protein
MAIRSPQEVFADHLQLRKQGNLSLPHASIIKTLVALGISQTPFGKRQHALGLGRMPLVNEGYLVKVFLNGTSCLTGHCPDPIRGSHCRRC